MNIYIGNLNYSVKESNLKQVLEHYGIVKYIRLIKDKDTGNSKLKSNDRSIVNFENKPYDYYYYKKYKAYTMYDKTSEIVFSFIWIGDRYKDVRSYDDGIDLLKKLNIELKKFNERLKGEINHEYRKTNK